MVLRSSASFLENQREISGVYCIATVQCVSSNGLYCCSRGHFEEAKKAWEEYGVDSEMFVIIIDEIDAICKPRGTQQHCDYTMLKSFTGHLSSGSKKGGWRATEAEASPPQLLKKGPHKCI